MAHRGYLHLFFLVADIHISHCIHTKNKDFRDLGYLHLFFLVADIHISYCIHTKKKQGF